MRRCVMLCLTLVLASACQGDDATRPKLDPASSPSALISDGAHSGGNPDFFFLPPLVRDPKTIGGVPNPLWDAGAANSSLTPTVRICELDVVATSAGKVATLPTDATPCKAGAYDLTTILTSANVSRGILDDVDIDNAVTRFISHYSSFVEPYYHLGWKVPAAPIGTSTPPKFYRIRVAVGSSKLGVLDVESVNNFQQLLNVKTNEFVPLTGSLRVAINFRIERYALCETPGAATCSSASGDIAVAPLTVSTGVPDPSGISTTVGVTIPIQPTLASTPLTVTITSCPNLNPSVIDLPTFGDCTRITTDPVLLEPLPNPATVFVCAVGVNATLFEGLSEQQEQRVTLHRYDAAGPRAGVVALPHANACTPGTPGGVASTNPTVGQMLASLARGQLKRAASQAVAMLAPKPLYAAMFIDLGGGGLTEFFSDFQFALPAKMEIVDGDGQVARPGAQLLVAPTVKVTDLDNNPVRGARVTFATLDGGGVAVVPSLPGESLAACQGGENCAVAISDAQGLARASWTLREQVGANALIARGRGLGGADFNGPRGQSPTGGFDEIRDPFQPIQSLYAPPDASTREVNVRTGSVQFSATGELRVVIYGPTLTPPVSPYLQNEQLLASAAGLAVTVWDAATWSTKTTADFAQFNAIVFADPVIGSNCALNPSLLTTANGNKAIWSPAVNGPIVIIGTDPVLHQPGHPQAVTLMSNAVKFAASNPTRTGLYATLNCYYFSASSTVPTPVDFLSAVGSFSVIGQSGLGETVTIATPSHPVMATLTQAGLSNWHDSAHEAFPLLASYPAGFAPLALINKPVTEENLPYIIARGTPTP